MLHLRPGELLLRAQGRAQIAATLTGISSVPTMNTRMLILVAITTRRNADFSDV